MNNLIDVEFQSRFVIRGFEASNKLSVVHGMLEQSILFGLSVVNIKQHARIDDEIVDAVPVLLQYLLMDFWIADHIIVDMGEGEGRAIADAQAAGHAQIQIE